jgi:hypothetical protein
MGTEDDRAAGRHFVKFLDEHRPLGAQVVADELVVHDFVAHVDRRAEFFQGTLDDGDGAFDAGAEAAGVGEDDLHLHDSDDFHLEADRFSGHRVVEVEQGVRCIQLTQEARKRAAVGRGEFDDGIFLEFHVGRQSAACDALDQARRCAGRRPRSVPVEDETLVRRQTDQHGFEVFGQLAAAHLQRRRAHVEGRQELLAVERGEIR